MKRAALALLLLVSCCFGFGQGFRITSFNGDLTLDKDGSLHVTERIEVIFDESHHGIFRDIPVVYSTGRGFNRNLQLGHIDVTDGSGRSLTTAVMHEGENVRIRIGDKDVYMPTNTPLTYVVRYDCFGQMNWFDDAHDWQPYCELYWNLTGDQWQEAMDKVSFTLHFPQVSKARDVRARLFAGPYGSRDYQEMKGAHPRAESPSSGTYMELTQSSLSGGFMQPMPAGSQLTMVLDMPAATIAKPTTSQQVLMFVGANLGFAIPVIVLVVMSLFWFMYGRDPSKKPIAAQFEPPDGLSGSEAGTLLDERVDLRDLAAGIVTLAVKGYLTITPKESGMVFKKRTATLNMVDKPAGPDLGIFEANLLSKLNVAGRAVTDIDETALRTYVAPGVSEMRSNLYESLVDKGYYVANPDTVRTWWAIGGIAAVVAMGVLFTNLSATHESLPSIIGGIVGGLIVLGFSRLMPRRTYAGAEAQRKVAGFEEFIRRARGNEINWQSQKQPTQSLFEEYLPHALAFGLAVEWASAFEGILHEMPSWYNAPYGTPFYPGYFGSDMVAISDSLGAAAGTPPRSSGASGGGSGFGGGGFSGGGFGGGGGGSW